VIFTGGGTLAAVSSISSMGNSGDKKCSRCELWPAETYIVGLIGLRLWTAGCAATGTGAEILAEDSGRGTDAEAPERYSL